MCRIPSHLSITLKYIWLIQSQPGIAFNYCASHQSTATPLLHPILLKNSRLSSLGNAKCKRSSLKRLHLAANQSYQVVVEDDGIEPTTPCLQSRCSPS
ncbi:protein of unknown function (plasmid) [Cupriavidus taiwanensis]|nr:protein of unknown function [Cupriavidus taiwanensis]